MMPICVVGIQNFMCALEQLTTFCRGGLFANADQDALIELIDFRGLLVISSDDQRASQ